MTTFCDITNEVWRAVVMLLEHMQKFLSAYISHGEAESLVLSLSPTAGRLAVFLSSTISSPVSPPLLVCDMSPHIYTGRSRSANNPLQVKLPKSRITAHLHSFIPLFSRLWNKLPHSILSHSSLQAFKTAVHHHLLSSPIQILDLFYPR